MLSFARYAVADQHAFQLWMGEESFDVDTLLAECELGYCNLPARKGDEPADPIQPISVENEVAALKLVSRAMHAAQQRYTTTIAQDDQLLKADASGHVSLGFNRRMMVTVRRGEKIVAQFWRNFCSEMIRLLEMPWATLRPIIDNYLKKYELYSSYVERVVMRLVQLRQVRQLDRWLYTTKRQCTITAKTKWPTLNSLIGMCPPWIEAGEIESYEYFWRNSDGTTTPICKFMCFTWFDGQL